MASLLFENVQLVLPPEVKVSREEDGTVALDFDTFSGRITLRGAEGVPSVKRLRIPSEEAESEDALSKRGRVETPIEDSGSEPYGGAAAAASDLRTMAHESFFRNGGGSLSQDSDHDNEDALPQPRTISWDEVCEGGAAVDAAGQRTDTALDDNVAPARSERGGSANSADEGLTEAGDRGARPPAPVESPVGASAAVRPRTPDWARSPDLPAAPPSGGAGESGSRSRGARSSSDASERRAGPVGDRTPQQRSGGARHDDTPSVASGAAGPSVEQRPDFAVDGSGAEGAVKLEEEERALGAVRRVGAYPFDRTAALDEWEWRAVVAGGSAPCPRWGHSASLLGGSMYVMGGDDLTDSDDDILRDLYRFDLEAKQWTRCRDAPHGRCWHTGNVVGGSVNGGGNVLLVVGGETLPSGSDTRTPLNSMLSYDPEFEVRSPPPPRNHHRHRGTHTHTHTPNGRRAP